MKLFYDHESFKSFQVDCVLWLSRDSEGSSIFQLSFFLRRKQMSLVHEAMPVPNLVETHKWPNIIILLQIQKRLGADPTANLSALLSEI